MAWDEWEQLKAEAAGRRQTRMQLNEAGGPAGGSGTYGDLKVGHADLQKIGKHAHTLFDHLWGKARVADSSSQSAAGDLSGQGFALGAGLQHVSTRWGEQLKSLMDACAQISNHMHRTTKIHADDDGYIKRRMSSIATLDAGFDERVGGPGAHNTAYDPPKKKQ